MKIKIQNHPVFRFFCRCLIFVFCFLLFAVMLRGVIGQKLLNYSQKNNAVSETREVNLNGSRQRILIEGKDTEAPLLIMLHGGPQSPLIFGEGYRGFYPELTGHYLTVFWDQTGCGINAGANPDAVRLSSQIDDLCALITTLRQMYPDRPLYLFGYSNGTVLSVEAATRMPDAIAGIVNYGPLTNVSAAKTGAYHNLQHAFLPVSQKTAQDMLDSNQPDSLTWFENQITLKTNAMFDWADPVGNSRFLSSSVYVFFSPDYRLRDLAAVFYANLNVGTSYRALRDDLYQCDETQNLQNLQVPLVIIQSKDDMYSDTAWLQSLAASRSNISFVSLDGSAHLPTTRGFAAIFHALDQMASGR